MRRAGVGDAVRRAGVGDAVRVSLDVTAVPKRPAGAGRYCLELASALASREDVALTLWARSDDGDRWGQPDPARVTIRAVAPTRRPLRLLWEKARLAGLVSRLPVEVHHGPHYTAPPTIRVPRIVTIHDLTFFDHPEWHQRTKVQFFRRAIRIAVRNADGIVCVSHFTASRLADLFESVRADRVAVIPHGVDHARFCPAEPEAGADAAALARAGLGELGESANRYVLHLGTVEPRKDLPTLVSAFARLGRRHRDVRLVLAGGPGWSDASTALKRRIAEEGVADRVVQPGYVSDAALPALLRGASGVAYPSLEEGFGLPALEAMACGAPLVTTTGSAMEEVAHQAALLVPPGDAASLASALDEILEGGAAVGARRKAGTADAAAYTWEASAAAHVALYRSVAAPGREVGTGPHRDGLRDRPR